MMSFISCIVMLAEPFLAIKAKLMLVTAVNAVSQEIDEGDTSQQHHHFVAKAQQPLVKLLLEQLLKQEENQVHPSPAIGWCGSPCQPGPKPHL